MDKCVCVVHSKINLFLDLSASYGSRTSKPINLASSWSEIYLSDHLNVCQNIVIELFQSTALLHTRSTLLNSEPHQKKIKKNFSDQQTRDEHSCWTKI